MVKTFKDYNIIKKIINLVEIEDKNVLEVGPGKGALTYEILKRKPKSLMLIEKDISLAKALKEKLKNEKNVKVFNSDILNFDLERRLKPRTIIFGNLPYNISSQILVRFLKFKRWPPKYSNLVLMFQKELAEKIIGKFKSKNYGRLSIITKYRLNLIKNLFVSNNCFFPSPKIMSCVLHFKPIFKNKINIQNVSNLEKSTNYLFSSKRKMINKNLKKLFNEYDIRNSLNINLKSRPADLEPEIYYKITQLIEKH